VADLLAFAFGFETAPPGDLLGATEDAFMGLGHRHRRSIRSMFQEVTQCIDQKIWVKVTPIDVHETL
jgi:hypothetical protein